MNLLPKYKCAKPRERFRACVLFLAAVAMLFASTARRAMAQAAESGDEGAARLSAGASASGWAVGYGNRKMLGVTAWVDGDTIRRFGFEGEGRWLEYHQTANVHVETYLGGVRYHFNYGRMQPYVKGLAGFGNFNFPYNFATGRYLVVSGGGGLDYKLTRRFIVRGEFEYQDWPLFTYGAMNAYGVNVGLRYRIF